MKMEHPGRGNYTRQNIEFTGKGMEIAMMPQPNGWQENLTTTGSITFNCDIKANSVQLELQLDLVKM